MTAFSNSTISLVFVILFFGAFSSNSSASELDGDWSLSLKSGTPAWLSIKRIDGKPVIKMRLHVGPEGPQTNIKEVNGRLSFTLKQNKKQKDTKTVDLGIKSGKLEGVIISTSMDGTVTETPFTGKKIPPVSSTPPDLAKVRFGLPLSISMAGTSPVGVPTKRIKSMAGESKTDSSLTRPQRPTSVPPALTQIFAPMPFTKTSGCTLSFWFKKRATAVSTFAACTRRKSWIGTAACRACKGSASVFGRIAPSKNAGKKGGEWQSYDLTLVDRHITVILNGEKVIDNQPVPGPTGGAVFTDPTTPGPIHLQGDHTSVAFRNIYLAPVIKE